jgi:polyhydroxybutyrate depolymerase
MSRRRVGGALALLAALALVSACRTASRPAAGVPGTTQERTVTVDRRERSYRVYTPATLSRNDRPLMIVLHGGLGNGERSERLFGMNAVADRNDFLVAYPDGIGGRGPMRNRRTWNAGTCCGPAANTKVDDVGFIRAMIDAIDRDYPLDRRRVYVTGMSNGGMMTYRLVCELPDVIAAAIPVAGTLGVAPCSGGDDVPLLHIHGTADENVPLEGGRGTRGISGVAHRSLEESIELVSARRSCGAPQTSRQSDGTILSVYPCSTGAPIHVRLVPGGGHTWFGADIRRRGANDPGGFSASAAAWEFARAFSR